MPAVSWSEPLPSKNQEIHNILKGKVLLLAWNSAQGGAAETALNLALVT
jgi:hypothetical protein